MKKILASMIIIIELLCFCNTTIAMAMSNTENTEVEQEVTNSVDNNAVLLDEQDKMEETVEIEEKMQEEKEALEIPKQEENALEEVTDVKVEEQEETNNNEVADNIVNEEKQEENQVGENVSESTEQNENVTNNETEANDIPDNQEEDKVVTLTFPYNNTTYSIDLSSKELGVNLDEYAYYLVQKVGTEFYLYCSKERIKANYQSGSSNEYKIRISEQSILVKINTNGTLEKNMANFIEKYMDKTSFIASNQNIYYYSTKIFSKNCGYEYDDTKEKTDTANEIVKLYKTVNIYEKPALNYDIVATIQEGMTAKRIKKSVNEVNGKVWDKIELSNGTEAYIISEDIEVVTDIKEINFKYGEKKYTIYLSKSAFDVNLDEYAYYFVRKSEGKLELYCSKERVKANYQSGSSNEYKIRISEQSILVKINTNGTLEKSIANFIEKYMDKTSFIASNQNIYYGKELVFKRNCGDIYDEVSESKQGVFDDRVKLIEGLNSINIYEKPGLNYDIIATLPKNCIIKRTMRDICSANGYMWSKVELNNGIEGYAISTELFCYEDNVTKCIGIRYNGNIYKTYLPYSELGINFKQYKHYYAISVDNPNRIIIFYSKAGIATQAAGPNLYETAYGHNTIKCEIDINNGISKYSFVNAGSTRVSKDKYIATNHIDTSQKVECHVCVYDSDFDAIYQKDISLEQISKTEETNLKISDGENLYNSMGATERNLLLPHLELVHTKVQDAVIFTKFLMPNASKALNYFLTKGTSGDKDKCYEYEIEPYKNGHTVRRIDIADDLIGNEFNKLINSVIIASENIQGIKEDEIVLFSNVIEANGVVPESFSRDWYLAVNNYRIRTQSTVKKENNNYILKLDLEIEDYYDWENDGEVYRDWKDTAAFEFYDMHRAGLARNYTNLGKITYDIQWQEGERMEFDDIHIVKGKK